VTSSQSSKDKPNLYLVLDLMPGVSHNDILHAYNRAINTYADNSLAGYSLLDSDSATTILEDIEKAFSVLGNPSKRREYDIEMGYHTWNDEGGASAGHKQQSSGPVNPGFAPVVRSKGSTIFESNEVEGLNVGLSLTSFAGSEAAAPQKEAPARSVIPMKAPTTVQHSAPEKDNRFEPNPEFEDKIKNCTSVDGAFLRTLRVYRGYSVDSLAHRTKLGSSHVQIVENEGPESDLPAAVYLRGHVFLICQTLGLPDAQKLATGYVDRLKVQGRLKPKSF
jgi:curved DNA-binding protein CbpA